MRKKVEIREGSEMWRWRTDEWGEYRMKRRMREEERKGNREEMKNGWCKKKTNIKSDMNRKIEENEINRDEGKSKKKRK